MYFPSAGLNAIPFAPTQDCSEVKRLGQYIPPYIHYLHLMFREVYVDPSTMIGTVRELPSDNEDEEAEEEEAATAAAGQEAAPPLGQGIQPHRAPSLKTPASTSSRKRGSSGGTSSESIPKRTKSPMYNVWSTLLQQNQEGNNIFQSALDKIVRARRRRMPKPVRLSVALSWSDSVGYHRQIHYTSSAPTCLKRSTTESCSSTLRMMTLGCSG